jgi:hypothetical protein
MPLTADIAKLRTLRIVFLENNTTWYGVIAGLQEIVYKYIHFIWNNQICPFPDEDSILLRPCLLTLQANQRQTDIATLCPAYHTHQQTEGRGPVVNNPVSYSGGPGFKPRRGDRLS